MNLLHHAFYGLMRTIITPYFYLTGYHWKHFHPSSKNYLVLSNHTTDWDFFLAGLILPKQMYFVASEHIFRQGITSRIIKTLAGPIPRKKGADSNSTVNAIKEYLRNGENVCMFADGNRSYFGETGFISPRTAQLAKESGAALITVAIHGGYFISPRWSKKVRRGNYYGEVVNEYSTDQLSQMSVDEINIAIQRDLHVDAYAEQNKKPVKYRGKRLAESLETALFWCPKCGSYSSLYSSGNKFACSSCVMELFINEYGYFKSASDGDPPYKTVRDWYKAELLQLHKYCAEPRALDTPLFSDDPHMLVKVIPEKGTIPVAEGRIVLFNDRLEIQDPAGAFTVSLNSIEKISIILKDTILFTANGGYYEIHSAEKPYSALKYLIASRLLVGKEYI